MENIIYNIIGLKINSGNLDKLFKYNVYHWAEIPRRVKKSGNFTCRKKKYLKIKIKYPLLSITKEKTR